MDSIFFSSFFFFLTFSLRTDPFLQVRIMLAVTEKGDANKLAERACQDPEFNLNEMDEFGFTLMHYACESDSTSAVIPLLLAHPDIDVNVKSAYGSTSCCLACANGCTSCVRELLKDSRVNVNEPANDGWTPLWSAARYGHLDAIRWWIASGREMDMGEPGDLNTDAVWGAKMGVNPEVATLLERSKSEATQTRHTVRLEIGWYDETAAEVFALVVFVSDGLLQIKDTTPSSAARFIGIAKRLPLELQMVLCFRQVGSDKEIIPGKDSEAAFKSLAKSLHQLAPR